VLIDIEGTMGLREIADSNIPRALAEGVGA
jgi:hypothetical protein